MSSFIGVLFAVMSDASHSQRLLKMITCARTLWFSILYAVKLDGSVSSCLAFPPTILRWSLSVITFLARGMSSLFHHFSWMVWWALTDTWFFQFFFSKSLFALFSASSSSFINVYPIRSSTAALRQNTILTAVDGLPYYFFPSVRALATRTTNWNFREVHKSSRTLTVLSMALAFNKKWPSSLIPSAMYWCLDFTHPCYIRYTAINRTCILT